eukprot:scaffold10161_cov134-Skeletonema_marinoi.AAC.8
MIPLPLDDTHDPIETAERFAASDSPTCWMENFRKPQSFSEFLRRSFQLSFDFIDVTPCLAYVRGNQQLVAREAGCHVDEIDESR